MTLTAIGIAVGDRVIDFQDVSGMSDAAKGLAKTGFKKVELKKLLTELPEEELLRDIDSIKLAPGESPTGDIAILLNIRDMASGIEKTKNTIESIETKWREIEAESDRLSAELADFEEKRKSRKAKKSKQKPTRDEAPKPSVAKKEMDSDSDESSDEDKCETILSEIKTDAETLLEFYDAKSFEYSHQISQQYKNIFNIIKTHESSQSELRAASYK